MLKDSDSRPTGREEVVAGNNDSNRTIPAVMLCNIRRSVSSTWKITYPALVELGSEMSRIFLSNGRTCLIELGFCVEYLELDPRSVNNSLQQPDFEKSNLAPSLV